MNLGPLEIGLVLLAILLLFGYKKLPDASRSLGRSLRIFKGEMKGMKDDDRPRPADAPALPAGTPAGVDGNGRLPGAEHHTPSPDAGR
ncbi:sec-independent protein translocase protein TatA [Blastococcus aggregatus]|uniref:Sec-independent protein translocase protein TatA n=1 Tax=Blastococcus aggregatus TaxID=38502 RepID=A0A285V6Y5_9ACTN|nr:Sec-independent protein translocase subunit TatA [Blastococcus aggregatus]SOC49882.1 sec-independent protein translocase protein TatA [Blastococcus aggregatus]